MVSGYVYIVESPSDQDMLDGRQEGRCLSAHLELAEIKHHYSLATSWRTFQEALGQRLWDAIAAHEDRAPFLHISAHGNPNGIGLTNHEFVRWDDLRAMLRPIHQSKGCGLIICLSSCESAHGWQMAKTEPGEPPFWALVSNTGSPTWSDSALAYAVFYHRFLNGDLIDVALNAMKVASGDPNFFIFDGPKIHRERPAGLDWGSLKPC